MVTSRCFSVIVEEEEQALVDTVTHREVIFAGHTGVVASRLHPALRASATRLHLAVPGAMGPTHLPFSSQLAGKLRGSPFLFP